MGLQGIRHPHAGGIEGRPITILDRKRAGHSKKKVFPRNTDVCVTYYLVEKILPPCILKDEFRVVIIPPQKETKHRTRETKHLNKSRYNCKFKHRFFSCPGQLSR